MSRNRDNTWQAHSTRTSKQHGNPHAIHAPHTLRSPSTPHNRKTGLSTHIPDRYDGGTNGIVFSYKRTRFGYDNSPTPATRKTFLPAHPICAMGLNRRTNSALLPLSSEDPVRPKPRRYAASWPDSIARHARRVSDSKSVILARANPAPSYGPRILHSTSVPPSPTPARDHANVRLSPSWSLAATREIRVFSDTKKSL